MIKYHEQNKIQFLDKNKKSQDNPKLTDNKNRLKDEELLDQSQSMPSDFLKMINLSLFVFLISSCAAFTNVVEDWTHPGWRLARNTITIRIPQGLIRGEMEFYEGMNRSHISYRGIPYAQGQQ